MLVLSRHKDETIVLTGEFGKIEIMVTDIAGGQVRLGINAPKEVKVMRSELVDTIDNNQIARQMHGNKSALKNLEQMLHINQD